jgi:hypothetical protein
VRLPARSLSLSISICGPRAMASSDAPIGDRQRSAPNLSARVRKGQFDDRYRLAGLATHADRHDLLVIAYANPLDLHAEHVGREASTEWSSNVVENWLPARIRRAHQLSLPRRAARASRSTFPVQLSCLLLAWLCAS